MNYHSTTSRSLIKAITYRIITILVDSALIYFVTKSYTATIGVVIISNISSTVLYLIHERFWNKISWGRKVLKSK